MRWIPDAICVIGFAAVLYGLWLLADPLPYIAGGAGVVTVTYLYSRKRHNDT